MSIQEERKNQRIGLLTSVGIHFAMLLLFLFAMGWKAPNPPLSEYGSGVELNFGLDAEGSGEVQSFQPAGTEASEVKEKQDVPEVREEAPKEQVVAKPEETKVESTLTSQDDSPVEVKESKKEAKKVEPVKEVTEPKKKPVESSKEEGKVANEALYKKEETGAKKSATGGASEGDDKNKAGNKGSPEGSLDPNGQYTGKPGTGGNGGGGGNGFGLQMAGWNWDATPQAPKLPDNENGRIVFEIEVDSDGEITRITTLERGLSPEAERLCKQEIQKRSLVRTSGGAAPERSKGKITFVLRTQ